ncbi:MAG: hypothetical protein HYT08_02940 [Candidatus Levybacteria bacterium]|nr:hypothetical protein [Candidatus Levybacteria bacterium]
MIKKGLIAGVILLVVGLGFNWFAGLIFPPIAQEYKNPALFRPWDDPLMLAFFGYPFIVGLVLSYLWDKIKAKDPLEFAKFYFIIATIPGMFISYTSFQISLLMVLVWTASGFLQVYVAGFVFTKIK